MEPKTLNRPLSLGIFLANVLDKMPTRILRLDFHCGTTLVEKFLFVSILVAAHFVSGNTRAHFGWTTHLTHTAWSCPSPKKIRNSMIEKGIFRKTRVGRKPGKVYFLITRVVRIELETKRNLRTELETKRNHPRD